MARSPSSSFAAGTAIPLKRPLITAFVVMSVWAIFLSMLGHYDAFTQLAESARNLAFLAFMYGIMQSGGDGGTQRSVKAVYAAVAAVIGLQIVVGGVIPEFRNMPLMFATLVATSQIVGLTIAAGALILVHNLYGQAAPSSRNALRFPDARAGRDVGLRPPPLHRRLFHARRRRGTVHDARRPCSPCSCPSSLWAYAARPTGSCRFRVPRPSSRSR